MNALEKTTIGLIVLAAMAATRLFPLPAVNAKSSHYLTEKVWLSRTCTDSRWTLDEADDQTATLVCYAVPVEEDGP